MDNRSRKCDVCHRPFSQKDWEDRHWYHDEGCPQRDDVMGFTRDIGCDCDLIAHPDCCPMCLVRNAEPTNMTPVYVRRVEWRPTLST